MLSMFQHTYYLVTWSEILSDSPLPDRWRSELRAVAEWGEGPGQALSRDPGPGRSPGWRAVVSPVRGSGWPGRSAGGSTFPTRTRGPLIARQGWGDPTTIWPPRSRLWGCVEGPVWGIISEEAEVGSWGRGLSHPVGFWSLSVSPGCCNCAAYWAGEKMGTVKSWW